MHLKKVTRGSLSEETEEGVEYVDGERTWGNKSDICMASATQNEVKGKEAGTMIDNGVIAVSEGANMPSDPDAIEEYLKAKILYGPAKAANAGGVATSGLEMSQNSIRMSWTSEEVDKKLFDIMAAIFKACADTAEKYGHPGNFMQGANIAGFLKVAAAMEAQGCC